MIREAPLLVYGGGACLAGERAAHHLVVDAPADVVGARPPAVRPPCVQIRLGAHLAERIHVPAPTEQAVHPGALLGQEPGVLLVRPPVLQIDGAVRNIPVAAQDVVAAPPAQASEVRRERVQKAEFGGLAVRARGAGGQVQRYHRQLPELRFQVASFAVELGDPEAAHHALRGVPRVERNPGVALALGVTEEALIPRQRHGMAGELRLLAAGLLQADEVRVLAAQPAE